MAENGSTLQLHASNISSSKAKWQFLFCPNVVSTSSVCSVFLSILILSCFID